MEWQIAAPAKLAAAIEEAVTLRRSQVRSETRTFHGDDNDISIRSVYRLMYYMFVIYDSIRTTAHMLADTYMCLHTPLVIRTRAHTHTYVYLYVYIFMFYK